MQPHHAPPPPQGFIDVHSHLLPGVDDGCALPDDSIACVKRLIHAGFTGTICTPHIIPDTFPANTPTNIQLLTQQLQQDIHDAGLDYTLWPGGELRASPDIIPWLKHNGVPTLANSNCVLLDFWADKWPKWIMALFEWLLENNHQPILAHPERIACCTREPKKLAQLYKMGVWLQGNCRSITGSDGYAAQDAFQQLMQADAYHLLALDMHRPDSLEVRLDGMQLVATQHSREKLNQLISHNPRQLILNI